MAVPDALITVALYALIVAIPFSPLAVYLISELLGWIEARLRERETK